MQCFCCIISFHHNAEICTKFSQQLEIPNIYIETLKRIFKGFVVTNHSSSCHCCHWFLVNMSEREKWIWPHFGLLRNQNLSCRSNLNIKKLHFNLIFFPILVKNSNILVYPARFQSNIIQDQGVAIWILGHKKCGRLTFTHRGNFDGLITSFDLFISDFWSIDLPPTMA